MASSVDVARALTGTVQSHRPKNELIGHSRAGAFKPPLRVEPTVVTQMRSVQIVATRTTVEQLVDLLVCYPASSLCMTFLHLTR